MKVPTIIATVLCWPKLGHAAQTIPIAYSLDTAFILGCSILVMWMAAGFSMLECGLVRSKNVVEILTKNISLYAIACLSYLALGYDLMFAENCLNIFAANSGGSASEHAPLADLFFQMVFVATAMSVVSGAVAERMKLWAFLIFAIIMSAIIYPIGGNWVWGGGFLAKYGFIDFAGSGVVHLCGAAAALAAVILLGPRHGKYHNNQITPIPGSNLPLATLGTFILWFGWFGFNGGSQLAIASVADANSVAKIILNTNIAAATGLLAALLISRLWFGKADLTMILNGALAGLVAITAEPLSPAPFVAALIGIVAGFAVVASIVALDRRQIDDPVGALAVHGVGAILGLLAVPISHATASFTAQIFGVVTIFSWSFCASFITWSMIKHIVGIRVSHSEELEGVDICECGLSAYPEFTHKQEEFS